MGKKAGRRSKPGKKQPEGMWKPGHKKPSSHEQKQNNNRRGKKRSREELSASVPDGGTSGEVAPSPAQPAPKKITLSTGLKSLKFMSRKVEKKSQEQEMKRQLEQDRWVMRREDLEKARAAASNNAANPPKLVCVVANDSDALQLITSGRRSFGNFNKHMDDHNEKLQALVEGKVIAEQVEGNAMDGEEMAAFYQNRNKGRKKMRKPSANKS